MKLLDKLRLYRKSRKSKVRLPASPGSNEVVLTKTMTETEARQFLELVHKGYPALVEEIQLATQALPEYDPLVVIIEMDIKIKQQTDKPLLTLTNTSRLQLAQLRQAWRIKAKR
jgi:hypothetical protein